MAARVDVTALLKQAAAALPAGEWLSVPEYSLQDSMAAVELMEPKLDSGARRDAPLVPVPELLASGAIPVAALTPETTVAAMDALLSLEASWMRGNSLPQTVLTCLYTRPASIAALAQAAGIELPATGKAAAAQVPATAASAAAACAAALLGFVVATLVTVDAGGRAILAADMSEEEDTVLIPDHYRPVVEGFHAALGPHEPATPPTPLPDVYPVRAQALLQLAEAAVTSAAGASTSDASAFAPVASRLALRRGLLGLHAVMTPGAQASAPSPLPHGRLFDVTAACDAIDVAYAALCDITAEPSSALPKEAEPTAAAAALNACPGVVPAYQREVLKGTSPRFVPLQAWGTTLAWWRAHLLDTHALLQAYSSASYNPHRPLSVAGKEQAQGQETQTPAWKELCGSGSVFPRQTATQPNPAALTAYLAAAAASSPTAPLPRLPPSGLTDPPLPAALFPPLPASVAAGPTDPTVPASTTSKPPSTWATFPDVLASDRVLGDGHDSTAARGIPARGPSPPHTAAPRRHVSLHALFTFLELFSRRNADVIVRAWAAALVWQPGPGALPGASAAAAAAAAADPYADFAWAEGRSAAVLGSHTLMELVRGSLLDTGIPPELLVTIDFQKFTVLCELVWRHTLRLLVGTRLRIRRRIDTVLSEWAIVLQDCDMLDSCFSSYMARRCGDAAYAWARVQAGLPVPAESWAPVTTATLTSAGANPETTLRASLAGFPVVDTAALWRLHAVAASASTARLAHWAQDFAIRLQQLHLVTGWETQVYHIDETAAVWWYQDVLTNQALRVQRALAVSKATAAALPEAGTLAADTLALLQAADGAASHPGLSLDGRLSAFEELSRLGVALEEPKPAVAPVASSGGGGKKGGKGGKGGKGAKGAKAGGDEDDELLDMLAASGGVEAALEKARVEVASLIANWRKELETVLAALLHQHGTALSPASDAPRWRSRALDALHAESQLRRAGLKTLMAARPMGLWRGLERDTAPPTPGQLPTFFRSSAAAFEARFRAFDPYNHTVGVSPRRLTFREYRHTFLKGRYTKATTLQLLQEVADHASAARHLAQRIGAHAKTAVTATGNTPAGCTAAAIYAAAGGGTFLGASATPAAVAAAAAKAAAPAAKAGAKKGGNAAAKATSSGQPNPHYYAGPEESLPWTAGGVLAAVNDAAVASRIARSAVQQGLIAAKLLERSDLLPRELPGHPSDPVLAQDAADEFWEVAAPADCGLPPGSRVAAPYDARLGRPEPPRRTTALGLDLAQDAWFPPLTLNLPPAPQKVEEGAK